MAAGTPLVVPVAGPYTGTWDALPFGTLNDDGYELGCTFLGQEVNETDAWGMTLVEAVWRGMNWRCRLRGLEWKTGLLAALKGFGTTGLITDGKLTPALVDIGSLWSASSQTMVLTSILGNPPTAPGTLTALNSAVAPGSQSLFNLTSKVRELPLELVLLPYEATVGSLTGGVPFSTT